MQIVGDRHYKTVPGEQITFSVSETNQVGGITVAASSTPVNELPFTVGGGFHQTISIVVGFTGNDGGSAVIDVISDQIGSDSSRIRQITSFPFRDGNFTID